MRKRKDPDPGGTKTCGSGLGSETVSPTLPPTFHFSPLFAISSKNRRHFPRVGVRYRYKYGSNVADPGFLSRIGIFHPRSRIQGQKNSGWRIKEFKYFTP
jgi:hypothetical protein